MTISPKIYFFTGLCLIILGYISSRLFELGGSNSSEFIRAMMNLIGIISLITGLIYGYIKRDYSLFGYLTAILIFIGITTMIVWGLVGLGDSNDGGLLRFLEPNSGSLREGTAIGIVVFGLPSALGTFILSAISFFIRNRLRKKLDLNN